MIHRISDGVLKVFFTSAFIIPGVLGEEDDEVVQEANMLIIKEEPFRIYFNYNKVMVCEVNTKDLLSIEKDRFAPRGYHSDTTHFVTSELQLFNERAFQG